MSAVVSEFVTRVRAMDLEDISDVAAIERDAYRFPWSEGIFRDCLTTGYICRVLENDIGIVGYGIMSVGVGECHILNLCICTDMRGQGLGGRLLQHMLMLAQRHKGRIAFLEVRRSNEVAFKLYHRMGFNEIGIRENYYPDSNGAREDAIVLAKVLT